MSEQELAKLKALDDKVDKYKQLYEYSRGIAKESLPYVKKYNEVKRLCTEVWDPLVNIALELQKRYPKIYTELLIQYNNTKK